MHRLIFILILFYSVKIYSQDSFTSKNVEEKSYKLYSEKKWKELTEFGNKAISMGFDYYYLRLRMGIACYEQKNYRMAQKHFFKAYHFNSSEDILKEYLHYCYVFLGEYDEARKFSKSFSHELNAKLKTNKSPIIDYLLLEGGIKSADKSDLSIAHYEQFGVGHHIGKNISFFHAATLFDQKSKPQNLNQFQYYFSLNIPAGKLWLVSPSFHFINRTITFNPRPPPPQPVYPPWVPHPPPAPAPVTPSPSTKNYFVESLSVSRSISKFDVGVGATLSNIDSINQTQANVTLNYFPFGNNKLFLQRSA